jgi:Secretion system C-terminal sorting domain
MKKNILLLLGAFCVQLVSAQITIPVIRANFGVDADLRANYFNGAVNSAADDWFNNGTAGTGQFIIDTTGAAAIVSAYTMRPATRMNPFSRLMRPPAYSTVNNRLVLDAVFHRDFHGTDSTVFAAGSNKNGMSPASWTCPVAQNIPDKNDILDVFTHVRRAGPNVTDSLWMFGGISIQNTNGNRYFDFELYQSDIYYDRPNRVFGGYGPADGHTPWVFNAAGAVVQAGDIIFSAEFSGTGLTLIEARIWIHQSSMAITPINFRWGGLFDGATSSSVYGYASILPKTAGAFYTGLQCAANTWAGPFALVQQDNSVVTNYVANQFLEISVNLTKLGIDPGNFSNSPCGTPFRRVLIKTRASSSFTAELKDFVAPFRMFDYPPVDAFTDIIYFCEVFPPTVISVLNPNPTSIYTWTTTNGRILGSNIGTSITVDLPGTYVVTQQLHSQCSYYSMDSVTMLFDSVCAVLDVDIYNFNGRRSSSNVTLSWDISNNRDVAALDVEYSFNNREFLKQSGVSPGSESEIANYFFISACPPGNPAVIYYRVKVTSRGGSVKYSKIIALRNPAAGSNHVTLFPNPTSGQTWLSFNSQQHEIAEISIWNAAGKTVINDKIEIKPGDNLLSLPNLMGKPPGVYFVKMLTKDGLIVKRIFLTQ